MPNRPSSAAVDDADGGNVVLCTSTLFQEFQEVSQKLMIDETGGVTTKLLLKRTHDDDLGIRDPGGPCYVRRAAR